jgi:O-antigen/teichoic acid export membrane protein
MLTVFATTDRLMVGFLRSEAEVGYYAVAHRLTVAVLVPADVLAQAFLPVLAAVKGDAAPMRRLSTDFTRAMLFAGTPLLFGTALLAHPLVTLFSGPSFAPAAPILVLLMLSAAASYAGKCFGDSLLAWDQEARHAKALATGAVVNVALNLALVPLWGGHGAALATAVATAFVAVRFGWLYRHSCATVQGSLLLRAAVAGGLGVAAPTLAVSALGWHWATAIALSAVAYLSIAYALGLVPPSLATLARRALAHVRP